MKRKITAFLVGIFTFGVALAQNNVPEYQIEGAGTGAQGTYLVNVWAMSKDARMTEAELARCAVHGVLFRGFSNPEIRQSQKPLATDASAEATFADFFSRFFADGGAYLKYVEVVQQSRKVLKNGKQYKVSSTVTVNKEQLRKDLEAAGIIKSINAIF